MTVEVAYAKFKAKYPDLSILSCYEYETCFVFNAVLSKSISEKIEDMPLDTLYAVQKSNGAVYRFNPFDISEEEYDAGKKIDLSDDLLNGNIYKKRIAAAQSWLDSRNVRR